MLLQFLWESLLHIPYCLVGCVFWHYLHKCCTHHDPPHPAEQGDFDMEGI